MISATRFTFTVEKSWKKMNFFTQNWLDHLPLMMSYFVTIETYHYWTWLNMRATDERTDVLSSRRKFTKTLGGGWQPLYVQGLKQTPLNRRQLPAPYDLLTDSSKKTTTTTTSRMTGQPTIWPTINDCLAVTIDGSKSQCHYESS